MACVVFHFLFTVVGFFYLAYIQSTLIITKSARTKFRLMQKHIVGPGETVHISMERKSVTAKSHLAKFCLQRKFSLTPLPEKALLTIHL